MNQFDFSAPAEFFRRRAAGRGPSLYRRFDTAAAAIRYAVEGPGNPDSWLTTVEVDEERFDRQAIRELYNSSDYPFPRKKA